jgi:hypothetical protein
MVAVLAVTPRALSQSAEVAGLVTEIKLGAGSAEVKRSDGDWRAVGSLLALRAGDQIRTTENAAVVVVLTGGRGTVRIDGRSSPWVTPAASGSGKSDKAKALVMSVIKYLSGSTEQQQEALISTRARSLSPKILTPHDGLVLGDPIVFEWTGSQFERYVVRVTAPTMTVLEPRAVAGTRYRYPSDAPALIAGVRYTFHVEARNQRADHTAFEIVGAARRVAVLKDLAELEASIGPAATPSSLAVMKAGLLASTGLIHDARHVVVTALATDPDEPTLYFVLGVLYLKSGLEDYAAAAFSKADYLRSRPR